MQWCSRISVCALALVAAAPACATGLSVAPLQLHIDSGATTASLSINNLTAVPTPVEVTVKRWTQTASGDVLEPTNELVFAPPILTVPAQNRATIRFRTTQPVTTREERAYRVYVRELPRQDSTGRSGSTFRVTFGVPLFVAGADDRPADLRVSTSIQNGRRVITTTNTGPRHIRVTGVAAYAAPFERGDEIPSPLAEFESPAHGLGTLLAGTSRVWSVDAGAVPGSAYVLIATKDLEAAAHPQMRAGGMLWLRLDDLAASNAQ